VGPLPLTIRGNRFIFTLQDKLSRFSYATPIPCGEAIVIAEALNQFISLFGIPEQIVSDNGKNLASEVNQGADETL